MINSNCKHLKVVFFFWGGGGGGFFVLLFSIQFFQNYHEMDFQKKNQQHQDVLGCCRIRTHLKPFKNIEFLHAF